MESGDKLPLMVGVDSLNWSSLLLLLLLLLLYIYIYIFFFLHEVYELEGS